MPRVSEFYGIAIYMYHNDHAPPHIHAEYSGDEAAFRIDTLDVLFGQLPRRARAFVLDRASQHQAELQSNWHLARQGLPLNRIDPLN